MRKILLLVLTVGLALGMSAQPAVRPERPSRSHNLPRPERRAALETAKANSLRSIPQQVAPQAIGETASDYESITDWVSIGTSTYTDIFVAYADGDTYAFSTYAVETEESQSHPGLYRLVNPAAGNEEIYYGSADKSQDYYMIVDATDPTAVTIPLQNFGYNNGYGTGTWIKSWGTGTLSEDLEITFGEWSLVVYRTNSEPTNVNDYSAVGNNASESLFSIKLPGAKDYTMSLMESEMCYNDGYASFYLTEGADIDHSKYAFVNGDVTAQQALEQARSNGQDISGSSDAQYQQMTEYGKWTLAVVSYDEKGNERAAATVVFFYFDESSDEWSTPVTAQLTENLVSTVYGSYYGPSTYNVEVEENVNTPGFYRVVNPYSSSNNTNDYIQYYSYHQDEHSHYIYIHAEDPQRVYIDEAPIGVDFGSGIGAFVAKSAGGQYGTMSNGSIILPAGTIGVWTHDLYNRALWTTEDDFRLIFVKEHTVSVSANPAYGTVAITSPAADGNSLTTSECAVTVAATPVAGASFLNWTDAKGNVLSTNATYTYYGSDDIVLTANFGVALTYTLPTNGTLVVTQGGNTVTSGTVFPVATVIDVKATPAENYVIDALTLNGEKVDTDAEGNYSFELSEATEIAVVFTEERFETILTMLATGNGHIEAWTEVDDEYNPVSGQIVSGSPISMADGEELTFIFIPGDGEEVLSASYTIGGETTPLELDGDFWVPEDNAEYVAKNICVFPFDQFQQDLTLSVVFSGENQGIEEIGVDEGEGSVEYYNLQGVRVAADNLTPGFYIVRQGAKAKAVYVRN